MKKRNNSPNNLFFTIIIVYFVVSSLLHFARLTFSWEIVIRGGFGEQVVPSYISGFCIMLGVLITISALKIISNNKKIKEKKGEEENNLYQH